MQAKLDAEFFGEPMSRLFGKLWAESDGKAIENTRNLGNPILDAGEADVALFAPIIEDTTATVLEQVNGRGIDAAAAKAAFEKETAAVMAEIGS